VIDFKIVVYLQLKSVPLVICIRGALKKNKQPQILSEVFLYSYFTSKYLQFAILKKIKFHQINKLFYEIQLLTAHRGKTMQQQ